VNENNQLKIAQIFELNSYNNDSYVFETTDKHEN